INRALDTSNEEAGRKIYVNGGLSRSSLWLQMMADIFNAEIYVSENHHGAAWGAAWTALVALGHAASFNDIKNNIPMGSATLPNPERSKLYQQLYANYEKLGAAMAPFYKSEEHTSELQSRENLVCRLLLERKKQKKTHI